MNNMLPSNPGGPRSEAEEFDGHNIIGLREAYDSLGYILQDESIGFPTTLDAEPNPELESPSFKKWKGLKEHGYMSGEMRVVIASLPGGPLGCSIEQAQEGDRDIIMRDSEDISTSPEGKGKGRMHWDGDPQFPDKGLTPSELVVVKDPRLLLSVNGEGKFWNMTPILKNNSTVTPAVSHPHPSSPQARIDRALEEFPRSDPHFLPQSSSASEPRAWFGDIVNRFWTNRHRHMSRQQDSFSECVSITNKENIPIGHSRATGLNMVEQSSRPGWPKEALPPEVFENIATFLPRDCLENMRLVNREFEFKVSPSIFRHVAIRFTPQNFGELRPQQGLGRQKGNEEFTAELINPPTKSPMEVIKTFWGTYSWPYQDYNRYEDVAGLEDFADDAREMKAAFSTLAQVMELGISLDNGLGWLNGPDVPPRAAIFKSKPKIFGPSNVLPNAQKRDQIESWRALLLAAKIAPAGATHNLVTGETAITETGDNNHIDGVISRVFDKLYPERATVIGNTCSTAEPHLSRETTPIIPFFLTTAQREWLLETDWAQRAFLSSYCLAVIDNNTSFQNLHSFNIARLPSYYLPLLCRTDFWSSLSNVTSLSLNIIPEWREVAKPQTGNVETSNVLPSEAVGRVYTFLQAYVGPNYSINTLSFGWVGGGEHAPGMYARNKNIMAAPLFMKASDMLKITDRESPELLLPHVENLTLSNCWISPAALTSLTNRMGTLSLKTLKLDSVSLSSGPSKDYALFLQPFLGRRSSWAGEPPGPTPPRPLTATGGAHRQEQVQSLGQPMPPPAWLGPPVPGSWAEVIEDISPGMTLKALRHRFGLTDQPPEPRDSKIQRIEFESCGYVLLLGYSFHHLWAGRYPKPWGDLSDHLSYRKKLLGRVVMSINDNNLGIIFPYFPEHDRQKLQGAWGFEEGWVDDIAAADNIEDGQLLGGTGRFRGVIDVHDAYWGILSA